MRRPPKAARFAVLAVSTYALLSIAIPALAVPPGNGKLQIIHLNAAQGNAAVLISPLGECVLFDSGANSSFCTHCPSCNEVKSELLAFGVTHVKYHFASHYHSDHVSCLLTLVNGGITVDQGWDRGTAFLPGGSSAPSQYTGAIIGKRFTLTKGKTFTLDSLSAHPVIIKCIALAGDGLTGISDENSYSVCMKISYGEFDEEIGGDLTGVTDGNGSVDVETKVAPQVGKIEVYMAHHHGSAGSTNENWLVYTQPKIAIMTVGDGNSYGHPTASVLNRLHNHGTRTYWSELGGGAGPNPAYDKVANGPIRIVATWEAGGVDSVYGNGIADSFTNYVPQDLVAPSVAMIAPSSGTLLPAGAPTNVTWSASDNVGVTSITMVYTLDDGAHWTLLALGIPNTGSYTWNVPNTLGTQGKIEITARDAANNSNVAYSTPFFSIVDQTAPTITVVAPNGGENWEPNSTQSITWNAADNFGVQSVDIDYSVNGAAGPWSTIQHGVPNTGSYSWTVVYDPTDSALVRLTAFDAANNQATDVSNNFFTVPQSPTGVPGGQGLRFALAPIVPNPSSGLVSTQFTLASAAPTRIDVLDVSGRRVWGTPQTWLDAGAHNVSWDGRDEHGNSATLGLYFMRLTSGGKSLMERFVRLK